MSICQFTLASRKNIFSDTTKVYRNIEALAIKRPSTKFVYGLVLRPIDTTSVNQKKKKTWVSTQSYLEFEGKIIRNIKITTLDPFGNSLVDSMPTRKNILYRGGNQIHKKTMRITIRNLLLFHANEPLDALLLKESERLMRNQRYIHDVEFNVIPVSNDSVDVYIRELDLWSVLPQYSITSSNSKIKLTDKNFAGTGHEFQGDYTRVFDGPINAYTANYFIPNIRNSYINTTLHYNLDIYSNRNKSISIDRPFFSPLARWAGGVQYSEQFANDSLNFQNNGFVPFDRRFSTQDYWGGMAFKLFKGRTDFERTTNLILGIRYTHLRYQQKPLSTYDPEQVYSNEDFILANIGISSRQYLQSKYIYNYGVKEDIPLGFVYGVTGGYQYKNQTERLYLGSRVAIGALKSWGYLSTSIEYGTYFRNLNTEQSVLTGDINYFTNLFELGNWKFRQFIRPQCTIGINRFSTEKLTINNEYGIRGFDGSTVGTKKILLSLQTQSYAPWNVLGFRFGPYVTTTFGMLGDSQNGFNDRRIYTQFGLGCLIKNEFLVFNTFQISFAFYPSIPGQGNNIVKLNPTNTADYGFSNFVLGKPTIVNFK